MEGFARRLRQLREEKGLSQVELGKLFNLSKQAISSYETGGSTPNPETLRQMAKFFGVSLDYLVGGASSDSSLPPGAFISDRLTRVPIYGEVRAGYPMLAQEEIIGYEYEPVEDIRGGEYFYLRVKGDSMTGARIYPGDLVLVRRQDVLDNGQIGVVMVQGEEATIKRVYRRNNQYILVAANPIYEPQVYSIRDVKIVGEVIEGKYKLNGRR